MGKMEILVRAIASLISLVSRLAFFLVHYTSILISLALTTYTIGEMTHRMVADKPKVLDILHWRDPKTSAVALALSLLTLILVAKFTLVSLVAWTSLLALGATLGYRIYVFAQAQMKKTDAANPFKPYLEKEINIPQEKAHAQADVIVQHGQNLLNQLRRLFLVESIFDSIKFGVLLWTLTHVGAWFSGITLVTLFVLGLFSVPKIYELYQEPIDNYIALARENVDKVHHVLEQNLPFLRKVEKHEKADKAE